MKKLFFTLFSAALLFSCSGDTFKAGENITEEGAVSNTEALKAMEGKDSIELKLTAKVNSVCQVKGCWMRLDMGDGKDMMVTFKDYAFFVPKDATGKTATVDGWAKMNTLSVAEQKHLAEDAGKSQAEIDAITDPKTELTFEAKGVILK